MAQDDDIRSLNDPFDLEGQVPGLIEHPPKPAAVPKPVAEVKPEVVPPPVIPAAQAVLPAPVAPKLRFPSIEVTGIIYDTRRPQAIINGRVVGEGDDVSGVKVLRIRKGAIDVSFQGFFNTVQFNNK